MSLNFGDVLSSPLVAERPVSFCPGQSGQKRAQKKSDSVFTESDFGAEDTGHETAARSRKKPTDLKQAVQNPVHFPNGQKIMPVLNFKTPSTILSWHR
jgi:hypothetical protein